MTREERIRGPRLISPFSQGLKFRGRGEEKKTSNETEREWKIKSNDGEKERRGRRGGNLLLLAGEVPNAPAHVLEAGAALAAVAGGDHLNPRPVEVGLVDPGHHFLHEVLGRVEVHRLPQVHRSRRRRRLAVLDRAAASAVQDGLQVTIDPLVARHLSHPKNSIPSHHPLASSFPPSVSTLGQKAGHSFHARIPT